MAVEGMHASMAGGKGTSQLLTSSATCQVLNGRMAGQQPVGTDPFDVNEYGGKSSLDVQRRHQAAIAVQQKGLQCETWV